MRMTAGYKMIGGAIATNVMSAEIEQKENAEYCDEWLKDARHMREAKTAFDRLDNFGDEGNHAIH